MDNDILNYCISEKKEHVKKGLSKREAAFLVARNLFWYLVFKECKYENRGISCNGFELLDSVSLDAGLTILARTLGVSGGLAYDSSFIQLIRFYISALFRQKTILSNNKIGENSYGEQKQSRENKRNP